jgi:general stress protein 26
MQNPKALEEKFWKAISSDMTVMLGLDGVEDGHARPMTAQVENNRGPIWFFTSRDNGIVQHLAQGNRAIANFASKVTSCSPASTASSGWTTTAR